MNLFEKRLDDIGWMSKEVQESMHTYDNSVGALIEAITEMKRIAVPLSVSGVNLWDYQPDYTTRASLCTCCQTIYNECRYLVDEHSARLNTKKLEYLEHLRNVCAHRFGSTLDERYFMDAVIFTILPIAESVKSMLLETLKDHPESGISEDMVKNLNPRKRRFFGRRKRST